ncbi:hypothetical protein BC828DRAFT_375944 [Blastocladiella britannica]|nr:hypothetical protein BC828DRAFT_375944 [Blastocladiella britannica]
MVYLGSILGLVLLVVMAAKAADDKTPIHNILPDQVPANAACLQAVADAKAKPCAAKAIQMRPALLDAWTKLVSGASTDAAQYVTQLADALSSQCTKSCGTEYVASGASLSAACGMAAFGDHDKYAITPLAPTAGGMAATALVRGWQASCMESPTSGLPCAVHLARANATAAGPAPLSYAAFGAPDASPDARAAHDARTAAWIASAVGPTGGSGANDATRATCNACVVGWRSVRALGNRQVEDTMAAWASAKGMGVVLTQDPTTPAIDQSEWARVSRAGDVAVRDAIAKTCGPTSPLTIQVDARTWRDAGLSSGDEVTGMVDLPAVDGYDQPGLGALAIVAIVLAVIAAVAGGVLGYAHWQRTRRAGEVVAFSLREVRETVQHALGDFKFKSD